MCKKLIVFKKLIVLKQLIIGLSLFSPLLMADGDAELYQRCSACHLPSGDGIPGAFPPLKNRVALIANSVEGRSYLIQVINKGLMGPLKVGGQSYMGVMPAQGSSYTAEQMMRLANYLVSELDKENTAAGWQAYTVAEIKTLLAKNSNPMSNARLRQALIKKYPELK